LAKQHAVETARLAFGL
jgi:hypothetical protein